MADKAIDYKQAMNYIGKAFKEATLNVATHDEVTELFNKYIKKKDTEDDR